ncbi:esterase B1 [Stomoxys calcitrans]|uniref:esterase B1 n=1 Tax=Stomoxys calcitrans TaxID=35570 RepID=UPI0027E2EE57|nr:esterase B1 [Stomoxys calcitrans]
MKSVATLNSKDSTTRREQMLQYQEISLPVGELRGAVRTTIYNDRYYSFEGIPYGQPPIGDLRFKAPLAAQPWQGVKDCTNFSTIKPIQRNKASGRVEGAEDCLYLNVFAKKLHTLMLLPVMVYIFGGGFNEGAAIRSLYGPDYFMQKDVVLVTLNYRVDSLGFLSVKDPSLQIPGNAGLKDQILALKWVKKFIRYFNGDPDNITLFGNSVGGASVHYLSATNQTRGLFHKAICMSGTMLSSRASTPAQDYAYRLAQQHGYEKENNDRKVIEYLQSLEAGKLVQHDLLTPEDRRNGFRLTFAPVVEPYESEHCVVSQEQQKMLHSAWSNEIPIIFGSTANEGLLLYSQLQNYTQIIESFRTDPATILPYLVKINNNETVNEELAQVLFKLHFSKESNELEDVVNPSRLHVLSPGLVCRRIQLILLDVYLYKVEHHLHKDEY